MINVDMRREVEKYQVKEARREDLQLFVLVGSLTIALILLKISTNYIFSVMGGIL